MIFGKLNPEAIAHEILQVSPPHLSDVATVPWEIQKSHFQHYYSYILLITYVISQKQSVIHLLTPAENDITLTCELQILFI